ncbi:MAG: amino acid ABC transporter substrate-binding protein [Gemmatales bacterium]|nr:MAG: amino acid ABC transporter substrate-binding protein [Gemmatales bacterium]
MRFSLFLLGVLLSLLSPFELSGQDVKPIAKHVLKVGIKPAEPFAIKNPDGSWSGIAVDLWRQAARKLGCDFEFFEGTLSDLLCDVESGNLDAAIGAITITADRERRVDFSHSFFVSELGLAVRTERASRLAVVTSTIFHPGVLKFLAALFVLAVFIGALIWLCERKKNTEQFGETFATGVGAGTWWSLVTMTTVGFGDKSPRSLLGRVIAVAWMFAGIVLIAFFTAAVSSAITVNELRSRVYGLDDLHEKMRIGTVVDSTSEEYLFRCQLPFQAYSSVADALLALHQGQLDVVVYDAPILSYWVASQSLSNIRVYPVPFKKQYYGVAFPPGSEWREPVNCVVAEEIATDRWLATVARYTGRHAIPSTSDQP